MKRGFFILGFPTVGKTTLAIRLGEDHVQVIDQDDIKKRVRDLLHLQSWHKHELSDQAWEQLAHITGAVMLAIVDTGGIVTYSDTLRGTPSADRIVALTYLAFRRDLETVKQMMFERDGVLHPNIDSWTNDWYDEISPVVVDLSPGEYASDYLGLINEILKELK